MARRKNPAPTAAPVAIKVLDTLSVPLTALRLGTNSRIKGPDYAEQVDALAASIAANGQLQPILARRLPEGDLEVIAGFTRYDAIAQLGDREILVAIVDAPTDRAAFLVSVLENVRNNPSPISVATAQKRLIDEFGYSKTEVAAAYGYNNTNAIARNLKLLELDPRLQTLLAQGRVSVDTALKIADAPAVKQDKLIAAAEAGDRVTSTTVADAVEAQGDGESEDEAPAVKLKPRNAAAVVKLLEEHVLHDGSEVAQDIQEVFAALVGFIRGKNGNKKFLNKLRAI